METRQRCGVDSMRGMLLVLSAPSGGGKSTIAKALLQRDLDIKVSVSATTRPQRPGEQEGVDYHFLTEAAFAGLKQQDAFLEDVHIFGHHYGTPKKEVETRLEQGKDVLFDISWQGMQNLCQQGYRSDLVSIFIMPPSLEELEKRLRARAQDEIAVIQARMQQAKNEMSHYHAYDYLIVNDKLAQSVEQVYGILQSERLKTCRQKERIL